MTRAPTEAAPIVSPIRAAQTHSDATKLRSVFTAEWLKMDYGIAPGRLCDRGRQLMPFDRQSFPFHFNDGIRSVASALFAR
jgi:hypothetical protein